jgi:hypothetical protein
VIRDRRSSHSRTALRTGLSQRLLRPTPEVRLPKIDNYLIDNCYMQYIIEHESMRSTRKRGRVQVRFQNGNLAPTRFAKNTKRGAASDYWANGLTPDDRLMASEFPEKGTNIRCQRFRFFHRREVSPAREFGPMLDVVATLDP